MLKSWWLPLLYLGLAGCSQLENPGNVTAADKAVRAQTADGDHMVSINAADAPPPPPPAPKRGDLSWPQAALENGKAWISCDTDYAGEAGDGAPLEALDRASIEAALQPCAERGLLRVRYGGKINPGFSELVARLAVVADAQRISRRILDLDSSGGQVEAAIVAGDRIGESNWTIWVREGSVCHSACVFVLAAGDNRLVSGKVGIHRMMRISSKATSRAELNRELHEVYDNVKDYLQRNGVAVGVADLMMTVPNRSLRLLTAEELRQFGLDGTNAVQDDLERIKQMRKCGDAFVRRKDAFLVAFDQECKREGSELEAVNSCGQALKQRFGFPDETCPDESPLSEIDVSTLLPTTVAPDQTETAERTLGDARPASAEAAERN
ncbi:COG3904 family protein [Stenotrophomonas bentonitica]